MDTQTDTTHTDLTPDQAEEAFAREEREEERIAEIAAADAESAQPGVGFVGCSAAGRLLRVRVANRSRRSMRVACPYGCGEHMTDKPMARALRDGEPQPSLIELPPVDMDRDPKDRGSGRRQVSDSAIFDAIPVGKEVAAVEVADALGYLAPKTGGKSSALLTRLRRMNKRAEKEGVSPPFTFAKRQLGPGSASVVIQRSGAVPSS